MNDNQPGVTETIELKPKEECRLCGSPKIYKYDGVGPLCFKCANGGRYRNIIPVTVEKKPGRNELCPCGSGKKYKKCCLNKLPETL